MTYSPSPADATPLSDSQEWWKDRWLDALASFGRTLRSARAHVYARQGNIISLDFKGNKILAKVQGSVPEPYSVSIALHAFSDEEWQHIIETMAEQAVFVAKLLAGEMPQQIEEVFTTNGLSLFPLTRSDIRSHCSCPDKANPCKHIGAVYYLLGDRFGADPFILFQLRGRSKEDIITELRKIRGEQFKPQTDATGEEETVSQVGVDTSVASSPNLDVNLETFWCYDQQLEPSLVVISPPPSSETVLDVLGPIPLKPEVTGAEAQTKAAIASAMDYFRTIYQVVSQHAVQTAMTDR